MSHWQIAPHGGHLVSRLSQEDPRAYAHCPALELSESNYADLELIATGVYSPLEGFLDQADYQSVVEHMRLKNGLPWSIPITLSIDKSRAKEYRGTVRLTLSGQTAGLLEVAEQYSPDKQKEALEVYRTTNTNHPGVAALLAQGEVNLAGRVGLFRLSRGEFPQHHYTPLETRSYFRRWHSIVGFQTRNPVHRAHEYLHKVALEQLDGLFLNPLVGTTKSDDIPAPVRMRAYQVLLDHYYPKDRVLLGVYPATMRYAGPREAILHAISRKNYGCTHFIVGRDHAGVGSYYGLYEAQEIFGAFSQKEMGIRILKFEHTFFCKTCGAMASSRTCPHDASHHLSFSGSKVREVLRSGSALPPEFTRPQVAEVLREAQQKSAPRSQKIADNMLDCSMSLEAAIQAFEAALAHATDALPQFSDEHAAKPWAPGKWSRKQVLGHLIDSASNNHQRFVRVQLQGGLELPGYAQDDWVAVQHYQNKPWSEIVGLWLAYNQHMLYLMRQVPGEKLGHTFQVGESGPITLEYLMVDYVRHLQHHLAQIFSS